MLLCLDRELEDAELPSVVLIMVEALQGLLELKRIRSRLGGYSLQPLNAGAQYTGISTRSPAC